MVRVTRSARAASDRSVLGGSWRACLMGLAVAVGLGACSSAPTTTASRDSLVRPSPRVVADGGPIHKGGGVYKVGSPYQIAGQWYVPRVEPDYDRVGIASWYGSDFHGRKTANGEIYDMHALTAAHPTLPLPSLAYVTNLETGRTILVRINDRGPYAHGRLIDLSRRSAEELGFATRGLSKVRVRYAGPAPLDGNDAAERRFLASGGRLSPTLAARVPTVTGSLPPSWSTTTSRPAHATLSR